MNTATATSNTNPVKSQKAKKFDPSVPSTPAALAQAPATLADQLNAMAKDPAPATKAKAKRSDKYAGKTYKVLVTLESCGVRATSGRYQFLAAALAAVGADSTGKVSDLIGRELHRVGLDGKPTTSVVLKSDNVDGLIRRGHIALV